MDKDIMDILKEFRDELKRINAKIDINAQLLKNLERSAQITKYEHDKTDDNIANIKSDVQILLEDISTVAMLPASNYI